MSDQRDMRLETQAVRAEGCCGYISVNDEGVEVICIQRQPCPDHDQRDYNLEMATQRGKVWFFPDGHIGHRNDRLMSGTIFYREDPPTLEVYTHGYDEGLKHKRMGQVFPTIDQLEALRDFLIIQCPIIRGETK